MTDANEETWTEEKQQPMVIMPSRGSVASGVTRALMNLAVLFFMLVVVGLAVASFFIRERFEASYQAELRLTPAAVGEVVQYSQDMGCARRALAQDYTLGRLRDRPAGSLELMESCNYDSTTPVAPAPDSRGSVPTRIVLPLPPDRPNLQVRIDALLEENARLRRPPAPTPSTPSTGGGGLPGG